MHLAGKEWEALTESVLSEIGKHLTFTEKRADDAEEDLKTVLILQLFQKRLGETIETIVSGLTNFGIFVQCTKFGVEGLIPLDLLGKEKFVYDHHAQCVYGQHSGKFFHIGMPLTVRIISVNIAARQLNVIPVEQPRRAGAKAEKQKERPKHEKKIKYKNKRKRRRQ
jgi:ribonuclease R